MRKQEFGKKYLILDLQAYSQFLPLPTFYLEAGDFLDGVVKKLLVLVKKF